jgi:exodeoxyribonuclease VII small subunit
MAKNSKNNSENPTFEGALKRLEKIVSDLESGDVPLEKSMELYEEGMKLSKFCLTTLDNAEAKLKKLVKNMDGSFEIKDAD